MGVIADITDPDNIQKILDYIEAQPPPLKAAASLQTYRIEFLDGDGNAGSIESDYCVCTIPASVLSGIRSDFSAADQQAIDDFI